MKFRFSYHFSIKYLFIITLLLLTLNVISFFYYDHSYHSLKKKEHSLHQQITSLDEQIATSLASLAMPSEPLLECFFLRKNSSFFEDEKKALTSPKASLTPAQFQDNLRETIALFKKRAYEQNIILPENFFLGINDYETHLPITDQLEKLQQEEKLLAIITEELLSFSNIKIEHFEFKNTYQEKSSSLIKSLGYLLITLTTDELSFQKLFNNIINNYNFLIIETLNIVNSNPCQPLHNTINKLAENKKTIVPLLGQEKITITLKIKLITFSYLEKICFYLDKNNKKSSTCLNSSNKTFYWKRDKNQSPLFTSRHYIIKDDHLVDLLEDSIMLYPPVPNEWLINNNLDYNNPNILFEDTDHDGFTNLEEWLGSNPIKDPGKLSSDPNNPHSHPLLWTKLSCHESDIISTDYNLYFLDCNSDKEEKEFLIQEEKISSNTKLSNKFISNTKLRRSKIGEKIPGLPFKILSYNERKVVYKNITYDNSTLVLCNPETQEQWSLIKKSTYHPEPTILRIKNAVEFHYRLFSPPKMLSVKHHAYFCLESLKLENGKETESSVTSECYQMISIKDQEVILKKDDQEYHVPITSGKCPD